MPKLLLTLLLLVFNILFAQSKKQIEAIRINQTITLDGFLNEAVWQTANIAKDFIEFEPYNGRNSYYRTEVKIMYNNNSLYIGAMMYDEHPDSIMKELTYRDGIYNSNSDAFCISLDPFYDKKHEYSFQVTAANVQTDRTANGSFTDFNWNAVWYSEVQILDNGWSVEMEIPFSALRLQPRENMVMGLNLWRRIMRKEEWDSWNFVPRDGDGWIPYEGELIGIKDITPPVRLSLTPYISNSYNKLPERKEFKNSFNGGLDLKYGIDDSFTLDVMIIPEFGQIKSDPKILELSPYETKYDENRQFFTENSELFSKADIFYSRRIGSIPVNYSSVYSLLNPEEVVIENPVESKILNSVKISGRNNNGLGLGFFNSITGNTYAKIRNSVTGITREILTQGTTNYNVVVVDQILPYNSFIGFINTNVLRNNDNFSANVTATDFRFLTHDLQYSIEGTAILSQIYKKAQNPDFGFRYKLGINKVAGNIIASLSNSILSNNYNPNHLGYLERNNYISTELSFTYRTFVPFWIMKQISISNYFEWRNLYKPRSYESFTYKMTIDSRFKNGIISTIIFNTKPVEQFDFFEPRTTGKKFVRAPFWNIALQIDSDPRNQLRWDLRYLYETASDGRNLSLYHVGIKYVPNDKISLYLSGEYSIHTNESGYAENDKDLLFGSRNRKIFINTLNFNYIFNNNTAFNISLRHYCSLVKYNKYFTLQDDGRLIHNSSFQGNKNSIFNNLTLDADYTWLFQPGSELKIVWKTGIEKIAREFSNDYFDNLKDICNYTESNYFGMKLTYYLDWSVVF